MKVLSAYLLAKLGGNEEPSADDLKKILSSVGIEAEDGMIEMLLSQVNGKDLAELIAAGREKMATVSSAGAAPVAVAAASTGGAPTPAPVEEKKEEVMEESDDENMFNIFD
ncbi:hypothetical protein ACHQM5_021566 [Ranunculus cassubicifolius]